MGSACCKSESSPTHYVVQQPEGAVSERESSSSSDPEEGLADLISNMYVVQQERARQAEQAKQKPSTDNVASTSGKKNTRGGAARRKDPLPVLQEVSEEQTSSSASSKNELQVPNVEIEVLTGRDQDADNQEENATATGSVGEKHSSEESN